VVVGRHGSSSSITNQTILNSQAEGRLEAHSNSRHSNSTSERTETGIRPREEFQMARISTLTCRLCLILTASFRTSSRWWAIWTHKTFRWTSTGTPSILALLINSNSSRGLTILRKILMVKKAASMHPTRPLISLSSLLRKRKKNSCLLSKLEQLSILTLHSSTRSQWFQRTRKLKLLTAPFALTC
jgi:hypothetical protein